MLFEEIVAVFVPRFFWKDKPGVGGALKIKNYTSVKSNTDQTSFNISFLGDFWIALGSYGIILSFFWGQVQARVFLFLVELVRQNWMSFGQMLLCLLYFDAAETDLYAALNWVLKVGILILIVNQLSALMRRGRSWDKKVLHHERCSQKAVCLAMCPFLFKSWRGSGEIPVVLGQLNLGVKCLWCPKPQSIVIFNL